MTEQIMLFLVVPVKIHYHRLAKNPSNSLLLLVFNRSFSQNQEVSQH
jgi:hypothetical protein